MSNCDTFAAHFNGVCPFLAVLCYPWSMFCLAFGVFFPRVRTPCGRCVQVIIERKGNTSDDGEKNTRKPPKRTQTRTSKQQTNKKRPEAVFPSSKTVFPLYGGETGEKNWLRTIYGPEFTTKSCQEGQCTGEEQSEASQRGFVPSKL